MPEVPGPAPVRKLLFCGALVSGTLLAGCFPSPRTSSPAAARSQSAETGSEPGLRAAVAANPRDAGAQLRLIDHLLGHRHRYAALEVAQAARALLPDDARILRREAETLAVLGRTPDALRLLDVSQARDPQLDVTRASLLARDGRHAEAVRVLDRLKGALPAETSGEAAQAYLDALRPDLAARRLQPHATGPSATLALRTLYALSLLLQGRYQPAAAVLSPALASAGPVPVVHFYLGSALRLSGDRNRVAEAAEHLAQATTLAPNEPLFHYELALAHVQLRDLPSARASLEEAITLLPDLPEAQRDLARVYARLTPPDPERAAVARAGYLLVLEDPQAAIRALAPLHQRAPDHPSLAQRLALACHTARQSEMSVKILTQLRERRPDDLLVQWDLFRAERVGPRPESALATLEGLEHAAPDEATRILHERADLLQRLERYPEAEALYRQLRDREPENAVRHFELGLFLKLWSKSPDRLPEAEQSFRAALRLQPDYVGPHFRLGELLEADGRAEAAVTHLQRAHELAPDLWEALRPLGRAYTRLRRPADAEACFRAYRRHQDRDETKRRLELVSSQGRANRESRRKLYQFLLRTGRLPEATLALERYLHFHPEDPEAHRQLAALLGHGRRFQRQFEERAAPRPKAGTP